MKIFHIFLYRLTGECVPIVPFLGVLYANAGLSLSSLSVIFFTLAATVFVFEIPTGIIADRVNIKYVLILSRLTKLLAFSLIFLSPTFIGFIAAAILWGVSSALDSGAFQAYLYAFVRERFEESLFGKIYSRAMTAQMVGLLLSSAMATQIHILGFAGLQLAGCLSLFASLLSVLMLPSTLKKDEPGRTSSLLRVLPDALQYILNTPALILLLSIGILVGGVKGSLDEYTSLLLVGKDLTIVFIGYALFGLEIVKSLGAFVTQWVQITPRQQSTLLLLFGICFVFAGISGFPPLVLGSIVAVIILDAIFWINNDTAIQTCASDTNRATVASVKNFGTEMIAMIIFASVLFSGNLFSVHSLYEYLGAALMLCSLFFLFYQRKALLLPYAKN